jgi:hypothetical protein
MLLEPGCKSSPLFLFLFILSIFLLILRKSAAVFSSVQFSPNWSYAATPPSPPYFPCCLAGRESTQGAWAPWLTSLHNQSTNPPPPPPFQLLPDRIPCETLASSPPSPNHAASPLSSSLLTLLPSQRKPHEQLFDALICINVKVFLSDARPRWPPRSSSWALCRLRRYSPSINDASPRAGPRFLLASLANKRSILSVIFVASNSAILPLSKLLYFSSVFQYRSIAAGYPAAGSTRSSARPVFPAHSAPPASSPAIPRDRRLSLFGVSRFPISRVAQQCVGWLEFIDNKFS